MGDRDLHGHRLRRHGGRRQGDGEAGSRHHSRGGADAGIPRRAPARAVSGPRPRRDPGLGDRGPGGAPDGGGLEAHALLQSLHRRPAGRRPRPAGARRSADQVNPAPREDVGDGPQRLLDVDVRHPRHLDREQRHPRRLRPDAAAGRERAEQHAHRPRVVGHQQPPRGDVGGVLARCRSARRGRPGAGRARPGCGRCRAPTPARRSPSPRSSARRRAASASGSRPPSAARARAPRPACGRRRGRGRCGGRTRGRPTAPAAGASPRPAGRGSGPTAPAAARAARPGCGPSGRRA